MSSILIITAHPSSRNLTEGMAGIYKEEKEKRKNIVKLVDLYKDKQLPYLSFENAHDVGKSEEVLYYQEQLKWADEIVIVYPFWWGSIPAILKNWVDSVFTIDFAFKYGDNGKPEGLLQGKSVTILSTCGAPKFLYSLNGINRANKNIWEKSIVEFCGMNFEGFHLFGGMDTSGKNVKKLFKSVKKLANK